MLFPYPRHIILCLVLVVQPRKRPDMAKNLLTGMGGFRGGTTVATDPSERSQKGFLSNTGSDPLKNRKATRLNLRPPSGRQRNAI